MKEAGEIFHYHQFLWSCFFEIVVSLILLFFVLGVSCIGGVAVIILSVPLGTFAAKKLKDFQKKMLTDKDERIGVIEEVLNSIRVVKV